MYLPEELQNQNYTTWNHTVKGLMRVWEIANKLGLEQRLEDRLRSDEGCALAERAAEIGNDPRRLADLYRGCVKAISEAELRARREQNYAVIIIKDELALSEKAA